MTATVAVQDLRVGMFVHLDVGWLAHPFPLSSFRIGSPEQIEVIRGLGVKEVRWSPERSDAEFRTDVTPSQLPADGAEGDGAADTPQQRSDRASLREVIRQSQAARRAQDARLETELAALRVCERQYVEACRDLRRLTDRSQAEPVQARDDAMALTRALREKMLGEGDLCVRLLGEPLSDRHTAHAMNVTVISLLLARALELPSDDTLDLGVGALLHDMGKQQLPDRVRLPRTDFSPAEVALYRDHVAQGVLMGQKMRLSPQALLVVAQHHEFADGSGFPQGLTLQNQAVVARIVAMINLYDNLCNAALPSHSLTPHEALSRMFAQLRSRFDVAILSAFIRLMGIYPPGSVVQLNDDRFAIVMSVNAARPLKPRVHVHDAHQSGRMLALDLETTPDLGIRRSLRPDQLPAAAAEVLAPRSRVAYFFDVEPVDSAQQAAPELV
jgi:putative nucleotidyltransferase with HDIG domain